MWYQSESHLMEPAHIQNTRINDSKGVLSSNNDYIWGPVTVGPDIL